RAYRLRSIERRIPHPEPALERVGVRAASCVRRQLLQVAHVATAEHDVVDDERGEKELHDLVEMPAPARLAELLHPALAEDILLRAATMVRQMSHLERGDDVLADERRAEAGAESHEQHRPAAVAPDRLHHGVVDEPHRLAEGAAEIEPDPS